MKKLFALLLAVLMVASLAACGSTEGKDGEAKTIVVGYTIYAPMNYIDEASGELIGFDTELAKAVFEGLGYTVIFQEIDWSSKYTDLDSGTIDCVWNGFTCNTADDDGILRSEKVDFSYNYMENRQVIVAKKDSGIASAADLSGKVAAVESGSAGESYAKGFEGATVKGFLKQTDCLMDVNTGAIDFAVVDALLTRSYVGKGDYTDLVVVENENVEKEFYAIGFSKGSALTAEVNAMLEKLAADGTIAKIFEEYDAPYTAP